MEYQKYMPFRMIKDNLKQKYKNFTKCFQVHICTKLMGGFQLGHKGETKGAARRPFIPL